MKRTVKRLLAIVMVVLMAVSLLPTTAFAYGTPYESVPLKFTVSSYSAPFINGSTGEHTVNSIDVLKYIKRSDVGSDNTAKGEASARAYFVGSNETGWELRIDVEVGNYKATWGPAEGVNARITNKDMSAAGGNVTYGLSFNTNNGTSTYISISGGKELPKTEYILTVNTDPAGGTTTGGGSYAAGTNVTVTASAPAVPDADHIYVFQNWTGAAGTEKAGTVVMPAKNATATANYALKDDYNHNNIPDDEEKSTAPEAPTGDEVKDILGTPGIVTVDCVNEAAGHGTAAYSLHPESFTVGAVVENGGLYTCDVSIFAEKYVAAFNESKGAEHALVENAVDPVTVKLSWNAEDETWTAPADCAAVFEVECDYVSPETAPVYLAIYRNGDKDNVYSYIKLADVVKGEKYDLSGLEAVLAENYSSRFGYVHGDFCNDGWYAFPASITVNGWTNIKVMVTDYEKVVVYGTIGEDKNSGWQIDNALVLHGTNLLDYLTGKDLDLEVENAIHDEWFKYDAPRYKFDENSTVTGWTNVMVKYTPKDVVQVVIYRNGDTTTPFKTVYCGRELRGTVLEMKNFDINAYYTKDKAAKDFLFEGWYNDGGWNYYKGGNTAMVLGESITVNGWTNIIAMVWDEYNVNYHIDGQTVKTDVINGKIVSDYELYQPEEQTGYTFDGWYEKAADIGNPNKTAKTPLGLKKYELYGAYNANGYSIVYHGNGGVLASNPEKDQTSSNWLYDQEVTLENDKTFERDGWAFLGWATSADGEAEYAGSQRGVFNFTAENGGKVDLYAVWTPRMTPVDPVAAAYKVEHYLEQADGTYALADTDMAADLLGKTVTGEAREYANYSLNTEHPDAVASGVVVMPEIVDGEPVILTLKFFYDLDRVTLSYDAGEGEGAPAAETKAVDSKKGEAEFVVSAAVPTREGYTFKGWQLEDGGKVYAADDKLTLDADATLSAVWEENPMVKYTLSYDANGGKNAPAAQSAESNTGSVVIAMTRDVPTREDYVFAGWAQRKDGEVEFRPGDNVILTSDVTLYAVWGKPVTTPKTGDESNMALWASLAALSVLAMGAVLVIGKKKFGSK